MPEKTTEELRKSPGGIAWKISTALDAYREKFNKPEKTAALDRFLGLKDRTFQAYLRGKMEPSPEAIARLSARWHIPFEWFFDPSQTPPIFTVDIPKRKGYSGLVNIPLHIYFDQLYYSTKGKPGGTMAAHEIAIVDGSFGIKIHADDLANTGRFEAGQEVAISPIDAPIPSWVYAEHKTETIKSKDGEEVRKGVIRLLIEEDGTQYLAAYDPTFPRLGIDDWEIAGVIVEVAAEEDDGTIISEFRQGGIRIHK